MEALRGEQGKYKADRGKTLDEMKRLQEGVQRKIKDVQAQRGKMAFRSVAEVDYRIAWVQILSYQTVPDQGSDSGRWTSRSNLVR